MKHNTYFFIFMLAASVVLAACSTSKSAGGDTVDAGRQDNGNLGAVTTTRVDERDQALSMADLLRRTPGVRVTGRGSNAKVAIRGSSGSVGNSASGPLFVVDGSIVGNSYNAVADMLPDNIDSITVLRDVSSTSSYGMQGQNGVILIETKKQ